jgi:hypothetical protein
MKSPVRIRVKIDLPHPLVGGGPSDETGKTEVPRHSRCGTIKNKNKTKPKN